jgi:tetratricopeptide (TPR) repeat protein
VFCVQVVTPRGFPLSGRQQFALAEDRLTRNRGRLRATGMKPLLLASRQVRVDEPAARSRDDRLWRRTRIHVMLCPYCLCEVEFQRTRSHGDHLSDGSLLPPSEPTGTGTDAGRGYRCPQCQQEIPAMYVTGYKKYPPAVASAVGFTGHGKSVYFAALLNELCGDRLAGCWQGFYYVALDDASLQTISQNAAALREGILPASTPRGNLARPTLLRLQAVPGLGGVTVCLYDVAGETFQSGADIGRYASHQFLARAKTVLFLVSLCDCRAVAKQEGDALLQLLNRYILGMNNHLHSATKGQNLVVVLTKADAVVHSYLRDHPALLQYVRNDDFGAVSDVAEYVRGIHRVSEVLRGRIIDGLQAQQFLRAAQDSFRSVNFCLVSSLGTTPTDDNRLTEEISSRRVLDPVLLLIDDELKRRELLIEEERIKHELLMDTARKSWSGRVIGAVVGATVGVIVGVILHFARGVEVTVLTGIALAAFATACAFIGHASGPCLAGAIKLDPKTASEHVDRGDAYSEKKAYDLAIADYTKAIELDPKYGRAYNSRGTEHHRKKAYDLAIADYTTAIQLEPKCAFCYRNRGNAHYQKKAYDLAIADYTTAIQLEPKCAFCYWNRGNAHYQKKAYDLAIADYTWAIELDPQDAVARSSRGNAHYQKKAYDLAIADYTWAIRLDPNHDVTYANRGNVHYAKKAYDIAIADYTRAIKLDPRCAPYYRNRGDAYRHEKAYDLAITDYTWAIHLDPTCAHYYRDRGDAYCHKKAYHLAIADYTRAIELDPQDAVAHSSRGNAKKAYDLAIADYTKAKDAAAHRNRGAIHLDGKAYDLAIVEYTRAIELDPQDAVAHSSRGNAHYQKKAYDLAIADYTRAIELDPQDAVAHSSRGNAHYQKKVYDLAIADYTRAIELDPNKAMAYSNRGNAHYQKKAYDLAIADYTKAIELDPANQGVYAKRADAYAALGDEASAARGRQLAQEVPTGQM